MCAELSASPGHISARTLRAQLDKIWCAAFPRAFIPGLSRQSSLWELQQAWNWSLTSSWCSATSALAWQLIGPLLHTVWPGYSCSSAPSDWSNKWRVDICTCLWTTNQPQTSWWQKVEHRPLMSSRFCVFLTCVCVCHKQCETKFNLALPALMCRSQIHASRWQGCFCSTAAAVFPADCTRTARCTSRAKAQTLSLSVRWWASAAAVAAAAVWGALATR